MARMIPAVISPDVKSNAERHIYEWFKNDPSTKDWIVLHSLGIVKHETVIFGEIDFLVLAPNMGIFVLEVKGGRVKRKDGLWTFQNRYGEITTKERGPFDQVKDAMFSLRNNINNKIDEEHSHIASVFYGCGVMFPDIDYDTVGCDEEQWQVFDSGDGNRVGAYIHRLFKGTTERWSDIYGIPSTAKLPTKIDVTYIFNLLRGDFERVIPLSVQLKYTEEALLKLTDEQYRCLDLFEDNKRCIVIGGAGTGKTLLAIEEAKRAKAQGLSVALFCFNNTLGEWLKVYFNSVSEGLKPDHVGTVHSFLTNIIKESGKDIHFPNKGNSYDSFYREIMPRLGIEVILSSNIRYDKIIIDESQDLVNDNFLDMFDVLLYYGLPMGAWTMYGDFSNQAIYDEHSASEMFELIEERANFTKVRLQTNCRNTKNICKEISLVSGFSLPAKMLNNVDGPYVSYCEYSNDEGQREELTKCLLTLLDAGIKETDITILSPVSFKKSVVSSLTECKIREYKPGLSNRITFSTIHSFKGLENSVIILSDITSFADSKLMYVALSRARDALYVLESKNARQEYLELFRRSL